MSRRSASKELLTDFWLWIYTEKDPERPIVRSHAERGNED